MIADYDIEGSDLGYRWNAKHGHKSLFPFGHGLSFTSFQTSGLKMSGLTANFTVTNTGKREGATVAQLYMTANQAGPQQRLAGFARVDLKPGESQRVSISVDPRIVAEYMENGWEISAGTYKFVLGDSAEVLGLPALVKLPGRKIKP